MKKLMYSTLLLVFAAATLDAQSAAQIPDKDTASIEAIVKAVYNVISGDAGEKLDWNRFRKLFHKDAKLIPTGKNAKTGVIAARTMTPDEYISGSAPYFEKNGFHEREIARRTEEYGNIAHVFSTYEAYNSRADKKPFIYAGYKQYSIV